MPLAYPVIAILVIFCLLLTLGVPANMAWIKAASQDWDDIISKLPLSEHAKMRHANEAVYAELLQLWLSHKVCYPRKFYVGCNPWGTRIMFTCKANPLKYDSLWAVAFIGMPWGKGPEYGTIVSAHALPEFRLDSRARSAGCMLPAVPMP